jgi:hypothetical protein
MTERTLPDWSIKVASAELADRLWLHPGTEEPSCIKDGGEPYASRAPVPVAEQRKLTNGELRVIRSDWHWPPPSCVCSFAVDPRVLSAIDNSGICRFEEVLSPEFDAAAAQLWSLVCSCCPVLSLGAAQCLGVSRRPSGLWTSTFDAENGVRIGMHLDSWDRAALTQRQFGRVRLCINLGVRQRSLLFIPYDVRTVRSALVGTGDFNSANIGERFCSRFRAAPVLRLDVPPGHAYVSPTENLIHDGHSEPSPSYDLTIAWLGAIQYTCGF